MRPSRELVTAFLTLWLMASRGSAAELELATDVQVGELEVKFFSHGYPSDPLDARLGRLESFIFGAVAAGTAEQRLSKLRKGLQADQLRANSQEVTLSKATSLIDIVNEGIDNYNKHRFHNAEDSFSKAAAMAPGMSRVHTYLACTFLQINERQSAIDEFHLAYEVDPFGTYGRYAKNALITIAGDEAVREAGPVDSKGTLVRALDKINKQTQNNQKINDETARQAYTYTNRPITINSNNADYTTQVTTARIDARTSMLKMQQDAKKRSLLTQESANNLKTLLTTKHMPGDAKLRAYGTTLNTRYYGNETYNIAPYYIPREFPSELHAVAAIMAVKAPVKKPAVSKPAVKVRSPRR